MRFVCAALLFAAAAVASSGCGSTSADNPADLGRAVCTKDSDCVSVYYPRCDTNSGTCAPCLPAKDNCPPGFRCVAVNTTYACTSMCRGSADCKAPKADCCSGLCTDTTRDTGNCGACGTACGMVSNGTSACVNGACGVGSCIGSYADCNKMAADGCESDTQSDVNSCGNCGVACPAVKNGSARCSLGKCGVASCSAGFDDCNASPADGCETPLGSDPKNCGKCGVVCSGSNSAQSCSAGACVISGCSAGFADCDKLPGNGCETNSDTDIANCGACGKRCASPSNATPACKAGVCGLGMCKAPFNDCDGAPGNGCESDPQTDANNCAKCGNVCPVNAPNCVGGACTK